MSLIKRSEVLIILILFIVLVHFLDDIIFINATRVQPMVPEHERMKIHEDMKLFFGFYSRMHECSTTRLKHESMNA